MQHSTSQLGKGIRSRVRSLFVVRFWEALGDAGLRGC